MDLGSAQHFVGSHFNLMKTFSDPSTCCQAGAPQAEEPNNSAWGGRPNTLAAHLWKGAGWDPMRGNFLRKNTDTGVNLWHNSGSTWTRARSCASWTAVTMAVAVRKVARPGAARHGVGILVPDIAAEWFLCHETSSPVPPGHRGKCYLPEGPQRRWQSGKVKNVLPVIVKHFKDLNCRTLGTVVGSAVGGPAGGSVGNVVGGTVAVVRQDKLLW